MNSFLRVSSVFRDKKSFQIFRTSMLFWDLFVSCRRYTGGGCSKSVTETKYIETSQYICSQFTWFKELNKTDYKLRHTGSN